MALAALVVTGFMWRARPVQPPSAVTSQPPSVAVIMPATRMLPDGSVVQLKEGARIEVTYAAASRTVTLLQGEAHFTVVKDAGRSFVVRAGAGLEVRAVGTAFSVQLAAGQVEVLVTEGTVAVELPAEAEQRVKAAEAEHVPSGDAAPVRQTLATVDAGSRVVVERSGPAAVPAVHTVSPDEQSERLSWRVPRVELTGAPLASVIPIFNRYGSIPLSLADESLGGLKVSGVLRPNNPSALLYVLKVEYGLQAEQTAEGGIVLRGP
jgi:transmembrane sensor